MSLELVNNRYELDGIPATELCKKYGTPLFVYDTSIMERQYNALTEAFKTCPLRIHYACKALSNLNVLRFFSRLGAGLDAVSLQEVELGIMAGFAPQDIMFTPNGVSFDEIKSAVEKGVRVNIDNLSILEQFGDAYGSNVPVGIRINPHIMAGGHDKISTGHIDSKFGISVHQIAHVHRIVDAYSIRIHGIHMHTGSDILDPDVFMRGAEILLETARQFPDLEYIDFGSGFKVPYKPDDYYTDIQSFGHVLSRRFRQFSKEYGRKLELIFEPGKFLVSEAGFFLVKVNVIKQTTSTVFAGVDSGFNHLIRPMFYDAYHHILNISRPQKKPRLYTVVGYICETDTFAWNRRIPEIHEGDILCFLNAGAYCYSMSSNYNSRLRPAEVLLYQGKDYLITRRETLDDLIRNQILYTFDPRENVLKKEGKTE
ncbi:MAG: diaminopimelate decarboxylase [Bacteroidales bacterium]